MIALLTWCRTLDRGGRLGREGRPGQLPGNGSLGEELDEFSVMASNTPQRTVAAGAAAS